MKTLCVLLLLSFTAEADKSVVESAAPAPTPDSSEDKPKEHVVEQSPPKPVEPSVEEKADDDGVVSNETSVESLKEANENNSNNADFSQTRGWYLTCVVVIPRSSWDIHYFSHTKINSKVVNHLGLKKDSSDQVCWLYFKMAE